MFDLNTGRMGYLIIGVDPKTSLERIKKIESIKIPGIAAIYVIPGLTGAYCILR